MKKLDKLIQRIDKFRNSHGTLPQILFIIAIVVCFCAIIIGVVRIITYGDDKIEVYVDDWSKAIKAVEDRKVGIEFNGTQTSEETYEALKEMADRSYSKESVEKVAVEAVVNEKAYVDGFKGFSDTSSDKSLNETGPVYLEDSLVMRYISESGDMNTVFVLMDKEGKANVIAKDKLEEYNKKRELNELDNKNQNYYSEDNYLMQLTYFLELLFNADTQEELNKAKSLAEKFFSSEGIATILDGKQQIKFPEELEAKVKYIDAGRSNLKYTTKDRVYAYIEIVGRVDKVSTQLVLKLNSNGRIYDIDLI